MNSETIRLLSVRACTTQKICWVDFESYATQKKSREITLTLLHLGFYFNRTTTLFNKTFLPKTSKNKTTPC